MNRTPLLRKLREEGATLYIFPSASEDIGLNLDSRVNSAALSHYALLNIPDIIAETDDCNAWLAEQLLNYVMNFETILLNQDSYNYQDYSTVSEKVFWHWADKQGWLDNLLGSDYKTEVLDNRAKKFIQCFGSIDAGNTLSTEFGMFNETYINIPTSYGNGPVFLRQTNNHDYTQTNYLIGKKYKSSDNDKLEGRDEITISGLSYLPNNTPIYDGTENSKGYYSDNNSYEIVKDPFLILEAILEYLSNDQILINSYDDVNVDAKLQFKNTDFDITSTPCEFNFNAILLYYSVYDNNDDTKLPYAINLFGIIFLNGPKQVASGHYKLSGLTKRKSYGSENNSFFGNSYSFRVNIKTMSVYDNTDAIIQDNTTMSSIYSVNFSDIISGLNNAISMMNTNLYATINIQNKYNEISKMVSDEKVYIDDISTKVNGLINGSKTSVLKTNTLKVNTILPETNSIEENYIKISLNRVPTDEMDPSYYQRFSYVSPIIIANSEENFNLPSVYKPIINLDTIVTSYIELESEEANLLLSILTDTSVNYYKYNNYLYLNITLPEDKINGLGFTYLLKYFKDEIKQGSEVIDSSMLYLNYDAFIGLIITYIQKLNTRIETLENIISQGSNP